MQGTRIAAAAIALFFTLSAGAQSTGEANFRELYKELVETNTALRTAAALWPRSAWPLA